MKIEHQRETRPRLSETPAKSNSYGPFLGRTIAKNEVRRGGDVRMRKGQSRTWETVMPDR